MKSGKKLIWNAGIVVVKPDPLPVTTPSPLTSQSPSARQAKPLNSKYSKQGESCPRNSKDVIGYDSNGKLVDLMCNQWDDRYFPRPANLNPFQVDQNTGERIRDLKKSDINVNFNDIVFREITLPLGKPKSALSSNSDFSNLSSCKLIDGDSMLTNMSIGFPIPDNRLNPKEPINLQILPVDFSNVRATNSPIYDFGKVVSNMTKFWESQSSVGLKINVNMPSEYLNLDKTVDSFNLNLSLSNFQPDNYRNYVQYVIDQWSTKISFKGINVIAVAVPPNISASQIGTWVVDTQAIFHTPSGNLYNTLITGNGSSITDLNLWTHEFGHTFGLTDMRFVDSSNLSIQRPEGLGIFDLMASERTAPETIVWNRFLTGMIRDDQVHCITNFDKSLHWILPVEGNGSGLKGVVIPLSHTKAIVMESRRAVGYDSFLGTSSEGLLVYEVDTTIPYHQSPVHIISPEGSIDKDWNTDSALHLNQFVVDSGWKITVIESGDFGDVVKVEKVT